MTHKLTVRFGGAADSEVHDYSDRVRYVDGSGPAILGGMACDNGTSSMGQFILDDDDNDIPHRTEPPGLQLAAHNQLIWSEDSPGYDAWLSIGRIDNKTVGRPYTRTAGVNRQWTGQWADANFDLDGITLTGDEARPAESDVDRVLWALATFCAGNYRLTTDFGTHLVASSPSFTMDAKTYPAGTELLEILEDCGQLAGKRYAVVIHEDSGADHACFQYIDEEDHTTYACTLSISDQLDEVDGEAVFEPVWRQGSATTEAGQELITGVVSRYGADTSATVFAEDTDHADAYDRWIKPYNDDLSVNAAQATARATAIVHSRWNEHVSHQPSILIPARLHNLIRAGMSIDIKSAAAMGGQYLNTVQTRRIANIEWSHAGWRGTDAMLWANLQLDRTPRKLPLSNGKRQPAATTPTGPSGSCSDVTSALAPHFIDGDSTNWGTGGSVDFDVNGGHNNEPWGGTSSGLDVNEFVEYHFTGTFSAGKRYTLKYWYQSDFTNDMPVVFGATGDQVSDTLALVGDGEWRFHQLEWTPSSSHTGDGTGLPKVRWGGVSGATGQFKVSDGSLEECSDAEAPPAADDTTGDPGTGDSCFSPCDHKHPVQTAAVTPFTPDGSIAATNVQDAIVEVRDEAASLSNATPLVESGSGSAGTATDASRSDHVHPADGGGGGGGGGGAELPLDAAATASIGSGDDFSGTTLDAGWSDLQSTALTVKDASIDGYLILGNSAAIGANVHRGIKRTFSPSGDFEVWCKVMHRRVPGAYHSCGIFFGDTDASDGASGNRVQLQVYRDATNGNTSFAFETFLGGSRSTVAISGVETTGWWLPSDQYPFWIGLRRVGTAVSCGMSIEGVEMSWLSTTTTISFTVDTCGLVINSHTNNDPPRTIFDYIATSG